MTILNDFEPVKVTDNDDKSICIDNGDGEDCKGRKYNCSNVNNNSDSVLVLYPVIMVHNTQLFEAVIVTAISMRYSLDNESSTNHIPSYKEENIPSPRNVLGLTPKTTSRMAKATAAAERVSSFRQSLLILLHLTSQAMGANAGKDVCVSDEKDVGVSDEKGVGDGKGVRAGAHTQPQIDIPAKQVKAVRIIHLMIL